jgi:hypothetical protein
VSLLPGRPQLNDQNRNLHFAKLSTWHTLIQRKPQKFLSFVYLVCLILQFCISQFRPIFVT